MKRGICYDTSGRTVANCSVREAVTRGGTILTLNKRSSAPRHNEIENDLARKICKDLGVSLV